LSFIESFALRAAVGRRQPGAGPAVHAGPGGIVVVVVDVTVVVVVTAQDSIGPGGVRPHSI
jgi:hypothetical protein